MIFFLSLIILSFPLLAQEDGQPDGQQNGQPENELNAKPDAMEEVEKAIQKVRTGFLDAVKEIDADNRSNEAQLELAKALVESMEELLAKLPESDGSGGSSGSSSSKPNPENIPDGNEPAEQPKPKPKSSGGEEDPEGKGEGSQNPAALFANPAKGGAWGQLPPRLQQTLEGASVNDLPLRYRGALERYHKRQQ